MTQAASDFSATNRVFLDLTTSVRWRGRKAVGISRTEREIGLRLLADPTLEVMPFHLDDGLLLPLTRQQANDLLHGVALPPAPYERPRWLRPGRLLLQIVPASARPRATLALIRIRRALRRALPGRFRPQLSLTPQPGDTLFTCGAGWEYIDWRNIAALRQRTRVRLVMICYDIIPILFPAWDNGPPGHFQRYFLGMVDQSDALVCISKTTERDILAFAERHGRAPPATQVVNLGSDLPALPDHSSLPEPLVARLSRRRFAITVGTFEVRKNYGLLLDIWDRLAPNPDFDLDLVIVGMRGWLADPVIRRLEESPLFGKHIFWLTNADDAALSWLYEACHLVLFPSLYEGWGLPVVEALQHRRPVIASDRGAVPEAALGIATIIDPENLDLWCDAVALCAREPRTEAPIVDVPKWDAAGAAVAAMLRQPAVLPETFGTEAGFPAPSDTGKPPPRGRALFIDHATPTPDQDAGSGIVVWYMKIFIDLGFEVTFLAADEIPDSGHYSDDLQGLGIVCLTSGTASPEAYLQSNAKSFDLALLYRVDVADRFASLLRRMNPGIKLVFNTVDLHFLRQEREAALRADHRALPLVKATRRRELAAMAIVDATILLSQAELDIIATLAPQARTWLIPFVYDIRGLLAPLEGRRDVLFIGGFAHAPNLDAILYFSTEVWPLVRARCPDLRLFVVGRKPTDAVLALDNPQSGIMVLGHVPDLDHLLAGCRLSVAPLRYGAGIKGKVVTSLAHGLPCVATTVAVEGIAVTNGIEILVADTPIDFAAGIVRLCVDDTLWHRISLAGLDFAELQFSVKAVRVILERMLGSLGV